MHHHLRSAASRQITVAIRQRIYRVPVTRSRSSPFHVSAPQFLPQPTPIRRQDETRATPPAAEETLSAAVPEQQPVETPIEGTASQQPPAASLEAESSVSHDSAAPAAPPAGEALSAAVPDQEPEGIPIDDTEWQQPPAIDLEPLESFGSTRTPATAQYPMQQFIPRDIIDKTEIWNMLRQDGKLKPDMSVWKTWSMEEKFKYKMITRFANYNNQEELDERQKKMVDAILDKQRQDMIYEGSVSDSDFTMAFCTALAKRLCLDREAGNKATGILMICNSMERAKLLRSYMQPLASCYRINTIQVAPIDPKLGSGGALVPYEQMIGALEDMNVHILIMLRPEWVRLIENDPDGRMLLNSVDWQTVVFDEAQKSLLSATNLIPSLFYKNVPAWSHRQHIFLTDHVSMRLRASAHTTTFKPVGVRNLSSDDNVVELATKVPQSFVILPNDDPTLLMPTLASVILRERSSHMGRFKALVQFSTNSESLFAAAYFNRMKGFEPVLPLIFNSWDKHHELETPEECKSFQNAKEAILFTYDTGRFMFGRHYEDLTHIIQVNPIESDMYVRRLTIANLAEETSATNNIPKAMTVTFPFEYNTLINQPAMQAQSIAMETPPTSEEWEQAIKLDQYVRQAAVATGEPLIKPAFTYEEWLRLYVPFCSHVKKEDLVARANELAIKLWGGNEQPELKMSTCEALGITDVPGMKVRDNLKQWRSQQANREKNVLEMRKAGWRGRKEWAKKHMPKPIMTVKGIKMSPKF